MSTCPISKFAGAWLAVGIVFQINTRLYPKSVTKRCVPSLVTEVGLSMMLAAAVSCRFT